MAKDPADRYQSAAEMRMDVQRAMNGMAVAAPTRLDAYNRTQAMGGATMMANPTTAVPPYQYGEDTDGGGEPPRRSYKALLWVLGLLVVLGAGGALAYMMFSGGGTKYAGPEVNNLPVKQAEAQIKANHLNFSVTDQASRAVKKGIVIKSDPTEGNKVAANTVVPLFVSAGPHLATVPSVTNESVTDAIAALKKAGLTFKQVADTSSTAAKNTVTK